MPTDYYPEDITVGEQWRRGRCHQHPRHRRPRTGADHGQGPGHRTRDRARTHSTTGSLTKFTLPSDRQIAKDTATVFAQNGWGTKDVTQAKGKPKAAVAVPKRLGDPSTIKHVFLLVKENRTYDQLYGDIAKGNGDPGLTQFGQSVTPNQHALANQFGLYDNTYDIGTNSAEGHNWLMQGDNPEYTESSAGDTPAATTPKTTFFATSAQASSGPRPKTPATPHATSANSPSSKPSRPPQPGSSTTASPRAWTRAVTRANSTAPSVKQDTESPIPSLNAITNHDYPKFDTDIPDLYRYNIWKQDFKKNGPANLNTFWLSSDHTGGTPDPRGPGG